MTDACHWAAPGVRCVCVNDDWPELLAGGEVLPTRVPMLGEVLTITHIGEGDGRHPWSGEAGGLYLAFAEIPTRQQTADCVFEGISWRANCFQPLIERKTDISVFTKILERAPADQRVEEPAHG